MVSGGDAPPPPDVILSTARAMQPREVRVLATTARRQMLAWGRHGKWLEARRCAIEAASAPELEAALHDYSDRAFLVSLEAICDHESQGARRELSEVRAAIQACRGPEAHRPSPEELLATATEALGARASRRLMFAATGVESACLATLTWRYADVGGSQYTSEQRARLLKPWRQAFGK